MRYKTLPTKGDIDPEMMLLQGAYALDAASEVAEKTNDVEGLLNAAAMWMKYSEAFDHYATAAEQVETLNGGTKFETGFQRSQIEQIVADEEEND